MSDFNWATMRKQPAPKSSSYLRQDWTAEEARFEQGRAVFLESIVLCNADSEDPCYVYQPEEISQPQAPEVKGVVNNDVKKYETQKGVRTETVESSLVRVSDSALQQTQRRENKVLQEDPLDPFSSDFSPKTKSNIGDDLFDLEQPKKPAATLSPARPASKEADSFEDFVAPTPKPPEAAAPAKTEEPKNSAPATPPAKKEFNRDDYQQTGLPANCTDEFPSDSPLHAAMTPAEKEGLDVERFNVIRRTIQRMLEDAPNHDLRKVTWNIGEYSVEMDLDHQRENPNILSQKILEIQAQRDSLWGEMLRVSPVYDSFKAAEKYLQTTAIDCSSRSSAERRVAHIKMLLPEFYIRLNAIERAKDNIDIALDRLNGQYDTISRLVTTLQQKLKIKEISRGAAPWEDSIHEAEPKKQEPAPDNDMVNRTMSQPLPVRKFNNMESFDPTLKPVKKNSQARGFTDF